MFKNLSQFFKGKDFLSQVFDDFRGMLNDAREMFLLVNKKLIGNENIPDLKETIYATDAKINALEREVRKRVIEHLTVQPSVDVSTSLLLMSVVKDAERLGDYVKNLYQVTALMTKPLNKDKYEKLFNGMDREILELFDKTKKAFIESDEDKAADSWDYERKIAKRCDAIISEVAKGDFSVNEGVCFALIARFYKRLTVHLTNIATSVILPITDLDYYEEARRKNNQDPE